MLGPLIIYLKGMRRMMFQLSGFYYRLILGELKGHLWGNIEFIVPQKASQLPALLLSREWQANATSGGHSKLGPEGTQAKRAEYPSPKKR